MKIPLVAGVQRIQVELGVFKQSDLSATGLQHSRGPGGSDTRVIHGGRFLTLAPIRTIHGLCNRKNRFPISGLLVNVTKILPALVS
jgi:hypothetical protein